MWAPTPRRLLRIPTAKKEKRRKTRMLGKQTEVKTEMQNKQGMTSPLQCHCNWLAKRQHGELLNRQVDITGRKPKNANSLPPPNVVKFDLNFLFLAIPLVLFSAYASYIAPRGGGREDKLSAASSFIILLEPPSIHKCFKDKSMMGKLTYLSLIHI